jgi:hypothetical protein
MWHHFRDIHLRDKLIVKKEGQQSYPRCVYCGMQTDPAVRGHWRTESCLKEQTGGFRVKRQLLQRLPSNVPSWYMGMYLSELRCSST